MKSNLKQDRRNAKNIGVDVGKLSLDIYSYGLDLHWQCDNNSVAIKALVSRLARYKLASAHPETQ